MKEDKIVVVRICIPESEIMKANKNCQCCSGRSYQLYEDSWDSDNWKPCPVCIKRAAKQGKYLRYDRF